MHRKDARESLSWCSAFDYAEGWAKCDGALVIYDADNPPAWFEFERDENGNSLVEEPCYCTDEDDCNALPGCLRAVSEKSPTSSLDDLPRVSSRLVSTSIFGDKERVWQVEPCGCSLSVCQDRDDCGRGRNQDTKPEAEEKKATPISQGKIVVDVETKLNGTPIDEYLRKAESIADVLKALFK